MYASKVTTETLLAAAREIGVLLDLRALNTKGTRHRIKVNPGTPPESVWQVDRQRPRLCPACGSKVKVINKTTDGRLVGSCGDAAPASRWANGRRWKDERGDGPYQRESIGFHTGGRRVRVSAVCWHGFRDFFRAVYRREPGAVFRTSVDTWHGSEDFESRYRESGHRNIGSQAAPVTMASACRCPERDRAA